MNMEETSIEADVTIRLDNKDVHDLKEIRRCMADGKIGLKEALASAPDILAMSLQELVLEITRGL